MVPRENGNNCLCKIVVAQTKSIMEFLKLANLYASGVNFIRGTMLLVSQSLKICLLSPVFFHLSCQS